jgi:predicted RNase H-like nuclease (RuvC/YqgF family)
LKVFGTDVIRGSVSSKRKRPSYALIIREDNREIFSGEVSLFRLMRRIISERPDILAVDSIRELSKDQSELAALMQQFPTKTKLVQVTGGEKQQTLQAVARRYNITFKNRFDPFEEARAIAGIAEAGGGFEVQVFEDSSDIIVSRGRSPGRGGWSQNRYVRKIHGAVLNKGREIEDTLKESGLKYEKREFKGYGGFKRVEFHVSAGRDEIPSFGGGGADVQVKVRSGRLDKIRYVQQGGRKKHLIVGIDPGTTFGFAAIDYEANLIALKSSRQMSVADWIEEISLAGKPVIVATDKSRMPSTVEKIKRAFSAVPFIPAEEKTQEDKYSVTSGYSYANDHERDALYAALEAHKFFKNKFRNIERKVPAGVDLDLVRTGLIRGMTPEQILDKIFPESVDKEPSEVLEGYVSSGRDPRILQLEGMVRNLKAYVAELEASLAKKDAEIISLEKRLSSERSERAGLRKRDAEIELRESRIKVFKKKLRSAERKNKRLLKQIDRLKRFADIQTGEFIPFKVIPSLTKDSLRSLEDEFGINEGDIIYAGNTRGWGSTAVQILSESSVQVLIAGKDEDLKLKDALRALNIVLIDAADIKLSLRGKFGYVLRSDLESALSAWQSGQEKFMRSKSEEMLESIVKEYQSERIKEVWRGG